MSARKSKSKKAPPKVRRSKSDDRDELFARAYVANARNATAAALEIGLCTSPKAARTEGSKLLAKPNVRRIVRALLTEKFRKLDISAERTLAELARIAYHADMEHFAEWDEDGVRLYPSDTLPDGLAKCVAEVGQTVNKGGGSIRIRLFDRIAALTKLAQIQRLLSDGDETPEDKARAIREAMARLDAHYTTSPA